MSQYSAPYAVAKGRDRARSRAGGGGDVLGALASGVRHVDAVEIDPMSRGVAALSTPASLTPIRV